jgi:hypothetical protein
MDMEKLDFTEGSFDSVVCSFGIFFVDDMAAQLRRMAGKARPGGKVLATCFDGIPFGNLSDMFFRRLRRYGIDVDVESLMQLSSTTQCRGLFNSAGLSDVRTEISPVGYFLKDESLWWDIIWNAGFRRFVAGLPEDKRRDFQHVHLDEVKASGTEDGIWLDVNVIYSTGII